MMLGNGLKRRLTILMTGLAALSLGMIRPAGAVSTTITISEVMVADFVNGTSRSGGEFVELRNLTNGDIDISGYKFIYRSSAGTSDVVLYTVPTGVSIPANGFYLLVTNTYAADHPEQVVSASFDGGSTGRMSGTSGGVGIRDAGGNLIDSMGFGTATNAFVETATTPVAPAGSSMERLPQGEGTTDTDNNSSDFQIQATPNPTATPPSASGPAVSNVTFNPGAVLPGDSTLLSATVTPGTNPTINTVTANLTPLGGSATAAMTFNGTSSQWELNVAVPTDASTGNKTVVVTATDADAKTGSAAGTLVVNSADGPKTVAQARLMPDDAENTVFQVKGIVTSNSTGNGYIQDPDSLTGGQGIFVYDGTSNDGVNGVALGDEVILSVFRSDFRGEVEVETATKSAADVQVVSSGNPLPAPKTISVNDAVSADTYEGQIIKLNNVTVIQEPAKAASSTTAWYFVVQDAAGKQITVYVHKNATIFPNTPPGPVPAPYSGINAVDDGLGNLTFPEITTGNIFNITGALGEDTNFATYTPSAPGKLIKPRFAEDLVFVGVGLITSATANPALVDRGSVTTLSVTTNPAANSTVTADLSALGGSATQALTYNGFSYTYDLVVPANAPLGPITIPVTVKNGSATATTTIALNVYTSQPMTIAAVRSAPEGTQVTTSGIVTSTKGGRQGTYYIQDATGGIFLFNVTTGTDAQALEGDQLQVTGIKKTFGGQVEIEYASGNTMILSSGNPLPAAKELKVSEWMNHLGELTFSKSLTITGTRSAGGNRVYKVTDGTAAGEIFIASTAIGELPGQFTAADLALFTVGSAWDVTGPVDSFASSGITYYQIKPRRPSDVAPGTAISVKGDVDKNLLLNSADAVLALKVAAGLVAASDPTVDLSSGDVVADNALTLSDAARILRAVNGLDTL